MSDVKSGVQVAGLAYRLGEIRQQTGLAARPFAALLAEHGMEVSHATVLAYEQVENEENVPAAYCLAVARACNLPIEYVMAQTDDPRPPAEPTEAQQALERAELEVRQVLATLTAVRRAEEMREAVERRAPRQSEP